jgi:hypothetical protein
MPFTTEVAEQLKEWGLTPEEMAQVEPVLGKPERQEKVKGSTLRQSEFTRKMQALDKQKSDLEAAVAEKERLVAEDFKALGTWKQTADRDMAANAKALEDAKVKLFQRTEKMKSLAAQQGVDPKEWGLDDTVEAPPKAKEPDVIDKRYLTVDDAGKILQEVKSNPFIAAELEDIVDEHRGLFGKGLNRRELVANALKNKRTLREEWETTNEVAKVRADNQEKEINARIESRVAEERTKILSENKLPVRRDGAGEGSPILSMRDSLVLNGVDRSKPTQEAGAVEAAVAAFNVGKYKNVAVPGAKTA